MTIRTAHPFSAALHAAAAPLRAALVLFFAGLPVFCTQAQSSPPHVPEVLAPAFLREAHGFAPGQLVYRNIINDRTTNIAYHNGQVFTHNVTGAGRRAWHWTNLSDVRSFQEFSFPGGVPLFNDQGNHAHTKFGPWLGGRFGFGLRYESPGVNVRDNFPAAWRFHQQQTGSRHNLYWPWGLVFDWVQYSNHNNGATIWRADQLLYEFNPLNEYGVTGNSILLGNLLFITSDETANGILAFDISPLFEDEPGSPVLLDKLSGAFGAYLVVPFKNYLVLSRRTGRTVDIIDISDPTNLTFVRSIDTSGHNNSGVPYVQAQDNFIFTQGRKINMETFEVEVIFDEEGNNRPAGSVAGPLDTSQYMRVVGPFVITGGMNTSGRNGVGIWVHQEGPDLKAPYVGYHVPRPGQTNFPIGAPISLLIHETLETFTIVNGVSIILRELGTEEPVDAWVSFAHDGVLTLTPKAYLERDKIYEVVIPAGLIKDAAGNGIEPYSFTFSTGSAIGGNLSPVIESFTVTPSRVEAGETVTLSVTATDPDDDPMEYRFIFGDGTLATPWSPNPSVSHTFTGNGHFDAKVQVRDLKPDGSRSQVTTNHVITVAPAPPAERPTQSSQMALDTVNRRLYAVNPDLSSVTAMDMDTLEIDYDVRLDVLLGHPGERFDPRSIALDAENQLWITCRGMDAIVVLNAADGSLLRAIDLDYGTAPVSVLATPNRQTLFVTTERRAATNPLHGKVLRFNTAGVETGRRDLGPTPWAMAMTSDGNRLFVSRFISAENFGSIWEINPQTMALTRTMPLFRDRGARGFDSGSTGKGVPNYVAGLAISPDNQWLWYAATKPNTQRGAFFRQGTEFNLDLTHDSTVRAMAGRISLSSNNEPNVGSWSDSITSSIRIDIDNSDSPSAIEFSDRGDYVFVTLQGNNSVAVFDHLRLLDGGVRATIWRIPAGNAPQGILMDHSTQTLFVNNFMSRDVSVHPIAGFMNSGNRTLNETRVGISVPEVLSPAVLLGKQIFYHASDEMSFENYISCATCHFDGGHDGRTFDFTQRGEGLRNTTDLRGRGGMAHGNVHWTANFDEIQDFIIDIMEHQLGTGFLPPGETPHPPLGTPNAGRSMELDALAAYVTSLDGRFLPRSPFRAPDGQMTEEALAGASHFVTLECAVCHAPQNDYHDSASGPSPRLHNVGTLRDSSGSRLGEPLTGIDTPTLLGFFDTAPYFHDGSAETVDEVFIKAGGRRIQAETGTLSGTARIRNDMVINMDHSAHGTAVQLRAEGDRVSFSNLFGGSGGTGAVELRYEATQERTVRLTVNGTHYDQLVPGTNAARQWRRVFFDNVEFTPGQTNQLTLELIGNAGGGGNSGFHVDDFTITTADDRALAEPHRLVSNLPEQQRRELMAYILQLDQSASAPPPADSPPQIIQAPADLVVDQGGSGVFSVTATGFPAPTFQWEYRSSRESPWILLPGRVSSSIVLQAVVPSDAGEYRVVVQNSLGSVTSAPAILMVIEPPPPPPIPTSGLIAEWRFDEASGTLAANSVNSALNGSLTGSGVTWTEGKMGSALAFGGSNAQVNVPSFDLSGNAVTFSLFARVDAQTVGDARFFGKASALPNANHTWMLSTMPDRRLRARLRVNGNTRELITDGPVFTLGEWFHAVMIYDNSTLRILVDGQTVASMNLSGPLDQQPEHPVAIGNHPQSDDRSLNGAIDQFRIYNRALSAEEIAALMNEGNLTSFQRWMAGLSNPPGANFRGETDDPDGDGIPNFLEYAFGGHPMVPNSANGRPSFVTLPNPENPALMDVHISYRRFVDELDYIAEYSHSLTHGVWTPVGGEEWYDEVTSLHGRTLTLPADAPKAFFRMRVSRNR